MSIADNNGLLSKAMTQSHLNLNQTLLVFSLFLKLPHTWLYTWAICTPTFSSSCFTTKLSIYTNLLLYFPIYTTTPKLVSFHKVSSTGAWWFAPMEWFKASGYVTKPLLLNWHSFSIKSIKKENNSLVTKIH